MIDKEEKFELLRVLDEIKGRHFYECMLPNDDRFSLRIYLTNACNLRCRHCFMYAGKAFRNELSYTEILHILKYSAANGCSEVIFTGGEVCLRKDLKHILAYAHGLGLYTQVLSNGTLWTPRSIRECSPYINEIQISIDGYDEDSNTYVRGAGAWQASMDTVKDFLKTEKTFVNVIITPLYTLLQKYQNAYLNFARQLLENFGQKNFLVMFAKEYTLIWWSGEFGSLGTAFCRYPANSHRDDYGERIGSFGRGHGGRRRCGNLS